MGRRAAICLLLLGIAAAPAAGREATLPPEGWHSTLSATHPLVGRLWSTAASEFADVEALRAQLLASRFVLLGEKHDNPDHHRLQAWAIEALVAGGRRPAVVLEMLNADQAGRLAAYLAKPAPTPEGLGAAVGWGERGWPDWSLYQPIAAAALQAGLPLSAGDFGAAARDTVLRDGLDGLPADERARLGLASPLPPALQRALIEDLFDAHCALMPRDSLARLADLQRLRDATLADSLLAADAGEGAVLIAGAGHVRHDRGVPWYLVERGVEGGVLSVALREVDDGLLAPQDYVERDPQGGPVVDYIWFTPRSDDRDHCAALAERLRRR